MWVFCEYKEYNMSTIINNSVITIDSTHKMASHVHFDNCIIDSAGSLDLSNSTNISITNCTLNVTGPLNLSGSSYCSVNSCSFKTVNTPEKERIEYMEEWLEDFDKDMYAQWVLWSGRTRRF